MGRWFITHHTAWRHQIASIFRCCCCCFSFSCDIKLFAIFLRRFSCSIAFDVLLCRWHYKLSHMAQIISFINTNWVMKLFLLRCLHSRYSRGENESKNKVLLVNNENIFPRTIKFYFISICCSLKKRNVIGRS